MTIPWRIPKLLVDHTQQGRSTCRRLWTATRGYFLNICVYIYTYICVCPFPSPPSSMLGVYFRRPGLHGPGELIPNIEEGGGGRPPERGCGGGQAGGRASGRAGTLRYSWIGVSGMRVPGIRVPGIRDAFCRFHSALFFNIEIGERGPAKKTFLPKGRASFISPTPEPRYHKNLNTCRDWP